MVWAIAYTCLAIGLACVDFVEAFWRTRQDPTWEKRWQALEPNESAWLAEMARKRTWLATLTDPEEIALAEGFRRHERRHSLYLDVALVPFILAAGILTTVGLPFGTLGLVASAFILIRGLVFYRRERQIQKTYQEAKDTYEALSVA